MSNSDEAEQRRRAQLWGQVASAIGRRYWRCRLENFELCDDPEAAGRQRETIEKLRDYRRSLSGHVGQGDGLVFHGPPGTGKDHLMVAMIRGACVEGFEVLWANGSDIFGDLRDGIHTTVRERDMLSHYASPDILALSDPVPPWGHLTQFQASFLFRLIDKRYRAAKPTWVTANLVDGSEASDRLGAQVVDRLRDGAITIHCNWPSYRKSWGGR